MTRLEFWEACEQVNRSDEHAMHELEKLARTSVELKVIFSQWVRHWTHATEKPAKPTN